MPKVSVIMPVYNQSASYLQDAIESITGQTFQDFEFIIIDDGTTDSKAIRLLDRYTRKDSRIHLIKNERNHGIVHSLNRALKTATGEYIARMDSDDVADSERLKKQVSFLEQHKGCDLVGTWANVIDETGKEIGSIRPETNSVVIKNTILRGNPLIHPTWMFRKSLTDKVGDYDPNAVNTEDYEFLLRIARNHDIANIPEFLLKYRFNTQGISFGKNKRQERNALITRLKAIRKYGYPRWQAIYLLRPLFFYLFVPPFLKKIFLKFSFKHL